MSKLSEALEAANIKILKYDPAKQRAVSTDKGTMNVEKFSALLVKELGKKAIKFPEVFEAFHSISDMEKLIIAHAKHKKVFSAPIEIEIPEEMADLTLNCDMTAKGRDCDRFFLTHKDETLSKIAGDFYLMCNQMNQAQAVAASRKVIPEYMPREEPGIILKKTGDGKEYPAYNKYVPPNWWNYEHWDDLPDKLPEPCRKLVNHLFVLPIEREYFYSWLYYSLFERSFVYLVLCGAPGTGKNRLKLLIRALHGHINTIDGKKSTLVERFNSQLSDSTLAWFDELHYDMDMENMMKELQNDSISIERKGVDATRATKIYASLVISNNKPRDNYIPFDARKFAPLKITDKRLEESMTPKEINTLSRKVEDQTSESFDVGFIAQIAKWIQTHGKSAKWPNLEYRGPMFYTLAHTSMSRWQKKAATLVLDLNPKNPGRVICDKDKGFLWSTVQEINQKKNGDRSLQFPDFTTIKYFFEVFKDAKGRTAFKTENVAGNIMGDFFVKPLFENTTIITEAQALGSRKVGGNSEKENGKKEHFDL